MEPIPVCGDADRSDTEIQEELMKVVMKAVKERGAVMEVVIQALSLADPPRGWTAKCDPFQLLIYFEHDICWWRKYPDGDQVIPRGDDWYCHECKWPLRWRGWACWWCAEQAAADEEDEACCLGGS